MDERQDSDLGLFREMIGNGFEYILIYICVVTVELSIVVDVGSNEKLESCKLTKEIIVYSSLSFICI